MTSNSPMSRTLGVCKTSNSYVFRAISTDERRTSPENDQTNQFGWLVWELWRTMSVRDITGNDVTHLLFDGSLTEH